MRGTGNACHLPPRSAPVRATIDRMDDLDARLAIKALAWYLHRGGRIEFRDSGAAHPTSRRTFTLSFTILDPGAYEGIWRRLMVHGLRSRTPKGRPLPEETSGPK